MTITGAALLVIAVQMQVRVVEKPYLLRTHGDDYRRYAACTGRFLPRIGRLYTPEQNPHGSARR